MMNNSEIDLLSLAAALWRNILLIALAAVVAGAATLTYTYLNVTPVYQSTASLFVNDNAINLGGSTYALTGNSKMVGTYMYLMQSRTTMEEVAKEAGVNLSAAQIGEMVSAKAVTDTSAFEVTVTSPDPAQAELIANAFARVLPDRIAEIVNGTTVRVVDYAVISSHHSGPNYLMNTAVGGAVGAALAACVIIVLTMLQDQKQAAVANVDELRQLYPDVMVLAMIPDVRQRQSRYSSYKNGYYGGNYGEYYGSLVNAKEKKHG